VGGATGSDIDVRAFRPGDDGPLADFAIPDGESEVDRYWVNAPYAYVVITYHDAESEHRYYAVEPELDRFERDLLDRVVDDIRDPLLYREGTGRTDEETLRTELEGLLEGYGVDIGMDTFHALAYYLYRDFRGYGKVDPSSTTATSRTSRVTVTTSRSSCTTTTTPTSRPTSRSGSRRSTTT